jgi:hypothetical protein
LSNLRSAGHRGAGVQILALPARLARIAARPMAARRRETPAGKRQIEFVNMRFEAKAECLLGLISCTAAFALKFARINAI